MFHLVSSCSTITPTWKKDDGSFNQNHSLKTFLLVRGIRRCWRYRDKNGFTTRTPWLIGRKESRNLNKSNSYLRPPLKPLNLPAVNWWRQRVATGQPLGLDCFLGETNVWMSPQVLWSLAVWFRLCASQTTHTLSTTLVFWTDRTRLIRPSLLWSRKCTWVPSQCVFLKMSLREYSWNVLLNRNLNTFWGRRS